MATAPAHGVLADPTTPTPEGADPRTRELVDLTVSRVLEVLTSQSRELMAAMQGDPVRAAVEFGTTAVREVAEAAERAQGPLPPEVLLITGVEVAKYIADVANQKGILPDAQIETFLKEVFQQSMTKYLDLDMKAGRVPPEQMQQMQQVLGSGGSSGARPAPGPRPPPSARPGVPRPAQQARGVL